MPAVAPGRDRTAVRLPEHRPSELLAGRIAVVTGGGRGIGVAIACGLADAGARVVVTGRNSESLDRCVRLIADRDGTAAATTCDIADPVQARDLLRRCADHFGMPDVLVNNAGRAAREGADGVSPEIFDELFTTNVRGPYYSMLGARRDMPDGGSIVTIGSVVARVVDTELAAYAASKAALHSLTATFAAALGPRNITVNAVAPGYLDSPLNADRLADPMRSSAVLDRTPLGRWGRPADVADAVCFLAGDRARFVTGQVISVDGGFPAAATPYAPGGPAPEDRGDGA